MQASSLVKRARRWPDMGVVSKDQELTQDLLQKMIDQLAEPFSGRKAGKSNGVRLKQMSATFVVKPIQSPFEDLSRRAQTRCLLDGVDCLRAGLEKLQEVVGMRDEDGEPSALDEGLHRVLQHGTADARGGNTSNRLGLTRAMIPGCRVRVPVRECRCLGETTRPNCRSAESSGKSIAGRMGP